MVENTELINKLNHRIKFLEAKAQRLLNMNNYYATKHDAQGSSN